MNQSKMMDCSDYSSFNPCLKLALSSLDLDLESELSRYRRLKNKTTSIPQVIPIESLNLREIAGLVHQPENEASGTMGEDAPDDYLASSARLLESLAENELLMEQPIVFLNPVKTAWGLSSLFVLLVGFSLLGLAFIPPEILTKIPVLEGLFVAEVEDNVNDNIKVEGDRTNLSESEFLTLDLHNLSTLKIKDNNKPISSAEPSIESISTTPETPTVTKPAPSPNEDLAKALLAPIINQIGEKIQEQTETYSATASVSVSQLNPSYYYVFTDYKGDRTLTAARQIISDAYLVQFPDTKKIQLGAFVKQEDANNLVRQLESRGISATIYGRQN